MNPKLQRQIDLNMQINCMCFSPKGVNNWHQIVFWSWISISLLISEYRFFLFIITLKTFPGIKLAKGYHLVFCAGSPSKAFAVFLQHKTIQTEEILPQFFFSLGGGGGEEGGGGISCFSHYTYSSSQKKCAQTI